MRKLNATGINQFLKGADFSNQQISKSQLMSLKGGGLDPGLDNDCDGIVDDGTGRH